MASAQTPAKLTSEVAQTMYVHNIADATVATKIAWVDMRGYEKILVGVTLVSGTGLLTVKLFASGSSTGADTPVVIRAHADPTVADAAGDVVYLECTAEELPALETSTCVRPRYVSVEVDCDHADDIVAISYVRTGGAAYSAMTADQIA